MLESLIFITGNVFFDCYGVGFRECYSSGIFDGNLIGHVPVDEGDEDWTW